MVPYIIIALLLLFLSIEYNIKKYFLCLILLFLFTAFRDVSVGTDTINYQIFYESFNVAGGINAVRGEYFYQILYFALNKYGLDYSYFLLVTSVLFYIPISYILYKNSDNPILSLFFCMVLGFIFMFFNISRQMLATSFSLFTYVACKNNNLKLFVISIICASFIHTTSLILVFLWFINKYTKDNVKFLIISSMVITFVSPIVFSTSSILDTLTENIGIIEKYSNLAEINTKESTFSISRLLMNGLFIYLTIKKQDVAHDLWFKSIIVGILILNMFPTSNYATRLYSYFTIAQIIVLPELCKEDISNKIIIMLYCMAVFFNYLINNNNGVVPYTMTL